MNITLITGEKNAGKSQRFLYLYKSLQSEEIALYTKKKRQGGQVVGYDLEILPEGILFPLIQEAGKYDGDDDMVYRQGQFVFLKNTFIQAEEYIRNRISPSRIWIDEIGRLELKHLGFYQLLEFLISANYDLILVVRTAYRNEIKEMLKSMAMEYEQEVNFSELAVETNRT